MLHLIPTLLISYTEVKMDWSALANSPFEMVLTPAWLTPTNGCIQFWCWLYVTWACFKMWHKQSQNDCISAWPWCRHLVVSSQTWPSKKRGRSCTILVSPLRIHRDATMFLCTTNQSATPCLGCNSLHYPKWPINEHQVTNTSLHKKEADPNELTFFWNPRTQITLQR